MRRTATIVGTPPAIPPAWARFEWMSCYGSNEARGKGLARYFQQFVPNLPLRGKLGWMTPRAGVKTTLATKRAFRGSRSQAGALFNLLSMLMFHRSATLVCSKVYGVIWA